MGDLIAGAATVCERMVWIDEYKIMTWHVSDPLQKYFDEGPHMPEGGVGCFSATARMAVQISPPHRVF